MTSRPEDLLAERPVRRTAEGEVRGIRLDAVEAFLGLHYGETTAGANRFRAPVPVRPWGGVRDAGIVGDACFQGFGSEDCLVLNVWAPAEATDAPVMVFLHGGGYRAGSGNEAMYDGAAMARAGGVVIVTVTHRLHILGFLSPGGPDAWDGRPNAGMLDVVESLRWVQRNIGVFGGDPGNVTVFGESGGGGKVCCLLSMPAARGLFHKAIVQSGAQRRLATPEQAMADAAQALAFLGLDGPDLATLQALPVERLYEAYRHVEASRARSLATLSTMPFVQVIDDASLPWRPADPAALALSSAVPVVIGSNDDEVAVYLGLAPGLLRHPADDRGIVEGLLEVFELLGPERAEDLTRLVAAYREECPEAEPWDLYLSIASELWMMRDTRALAEARAEVADAPTFLYRFAWKEPCFGGRYAAHAAELLFVFDKLEGHAVWGTPADAPPEAHRDVDAARAVLRDVMVDAWTSFARCGTPSGSKAGAWLPFAPPERHQFLFGAESGPSQDAISSETRRLLECFDVGAGA